MIRIFNCPVQESFHFASTPATQKGAIQKDMNATDEYDVNDEDFPINEATNPIGNTSKSFSSLLKMGKNKGGPLDQPDKPIRNPRPKLDFNRLLKGSRGLGYLAVCAKKSLKLSGKPGGEATDLSQISVYLQEWAKLVFPKMPLIEFLAKVEELCQSRLMKVIKDDDDLMITLL